jgi:glycosyltransferase involved in cell wall biosynthesis
MKIAIVLNTSWNIYNFRLNFIKELLAQGHEVHAVAPRDPFSDRLTAAGCIYHNIRMDSRGASPVKDTALIFELWLTYRKIKPDVVLHYTIKPNIYGSIAASWLGIPAINNVCGLGTVFLKDNLVSAVAVFLYKMAFKSPKKVFFQNSDDHELFVNRGLVAPAIADLLPGSGVDLNRFAPAPFRRNQPFTFLLISRLITDKGILEFIEAVRTLKKEGANARFQILGPKDPLHQRGIKLRVIDGWVKEGVIEYLGTTEDVRPYIHQADCVVLPSYREGAPRTLLEAASSGKPIVATDVPGCHHVVENNFNGLLCEPKSAADLADKMRRMMSLPDEELRRLGSNGRRKVEQSYAESLVIDRYKQAIAGVA